MSSPTPSRKRELYLACVGDIHMGHTRTPTRDIVSNFKRDFPINAHTGELDILFIDGDTYDHLLNLPDDAVSEIDHWIIYVLRMCAQLNIKLRVLEGTPDHDWKQPRRFETLEQAVQTGVDLKYVEKLDIEYIEDLGIHVLYIPDQWNPDVEDTYKEVIELMKAKGLTHVDYALMHGQFTYQLPQVARAPKHSEEKYLAIVKELILIGHVHQFSVYDRIIAPGSYDRLAHNEETPKGHVRARVRANGDRDVQFIENVGAKRYVTVNCVGLDLDETLAKVRERCQNVPSGAHVRVQATADNPVLQNMELLIREWPLLIWSRKVEDTLVPDYQTSDSQDDLNAPVFTPAALTSDNLPKLIMARLAAKALPADVLSAANQLLEEFS